MQLGRKRIEHGADPRLSRASWPLFLDGQRVGVIERTRLERGWRGWIRVAATYRGRVIFQGETIEAVGRRRKDVMRGLRNRVAERVLQARLLATPYTGARRCLRDQVP